MLLQFIGVQYCEDVRCTLLLSDIGKLIIRNNEGIYLFGEGIRWIFFSN